MQQDARINFHVVLSHQLHHHYYLPPLFSPNNRTDRSFPSNPGRTRVRIMSLFPCQVYVSCVHPIFSVRVLYPDFFQKCSLIGGVAEMLPPPVLWNFQILKPPFVRFLAVRVRTSNPWTVVVHLQAGVLGYCIIFYRLSRSKRACNF